MNFFAHKSAAERYSQGRPYFHPQIMSRIRERLSLSGPLACAIDIGCGTGLSTRALNSLAKQVVGADISPEMIALAPAGAHISYVVAPAERLPFIPATFDLMTVSQAFHWTSQGDFLVEAGRVLRKDGWLVVYDNHFSGQMEENAEFEQWVSQAYHQEFPTPPRASVSYGIMEAERGGFQTLYEETYPNSHRFSLEGLAAYLMTHTNVIAAVEGGNKPAGHVQEWLRQGLAPFFEDRTEATIRFNAPIWYLRKVS